VTDLWASFGKEATTPAATEATGQAFAALAAERAALRHYHSTHTDWRWDTDPPSGSDVFHAHEEAIEALSAAAIHWRNVVSALERSGNEWPQEETIQQDIHALIGHALAERLRVWTIAQHLLAEQVTCYQRDAATDPRTDRKGTRS